MAGMAGLAVSPGGKVMVNVFDGTRALYSDSADLLLTVRDGNQNTVSRDFHKSASTEFAGLHVFDNFGDNYTFLAAAKDYKDAGFFPVKIAPKAVQLVDLMLIPKSNAFNFAAAKWDQLKTARPKLSALFAQGAADDTVARNRYSDLEDRQAGAILACLLNITTAMDQIHLPQGTVLDYMKGIRWDPSGPTAMAEDRFFGWADPRIIDQIKLAKQHGEFADAPFGLHPGATLSYKQIEFGEANVQLTFHEHDRQQIDGLDCVLIEPDIDYFRDPGAHLLLEVAVNAFGSVTDPRTVYALRWIAGRRAGIPEFDPLYTIQKA